MRDESKVKDQEVRMKDFELNQEEKKKREETRKRKDEGRDFIEPAREAQIVEEETPSKRKAEDSGELETEDDGDVKVNMVEINQIIMDWIREVNSAMIEEEEEEVGASGMTCMVARYPRNWSRRLGRRR